MNRLYLFASIGCCSLVYVSCYAVGSNVGGRSPDDANAGGSGGSGGSASNTGGGGSDAAIGSGASAGTGIVIGPLGGGAGSAGSAGSAECETILNVIHRDFTEEHPDFESYWGAGVRRGLVETALGANRKPILKSTVGCQADPATPLGCTQDVITQTAVTSAETFAQWYTTVPDVNLEIAKQLTLMETAPDSGEYVYESSTFFPLEPTEGFGVSPANNAQGRNFLFTTEIHLMFDYEAGQQFSFRGDDDLWIFVNGKLALDLGGLHGEESGTIDFDAQAADLGITPGTSYAMDIFHAERRTTQSNFKFTTNISCFRPVVVK